MSNIPILKPQEVVRILESLGFVEVCQRGSHKQFRLDNL
ncbi:type II toxin-antitoxin system HicA family toxin [Calothrix sp. PCC 7507]|nr:type II toxin-antitoxin system HicA family toxin [Calothrix sp. PCC 7507]